MYVQSVQIKVSNLRSERLLAVRKISALGEVLVHEARDIRQGLQPRLRPGPQNHLIAALLDLHFRAFKAEVPGQPNGLTATVLEELRSCHSYRV